ncbi:MAG: Rrf2 family transcriptional regulator [Pseudomonadota bacterium]
MRLTSYADYAMRVLMYLGLAQDRLATIQEIADAFGISKNHLMKIVHDLQLAGYIQSVRGRAGGIRLGRPPHEILVGDVIRHCEEDFQLVECFATETNRCKIFGPCALHGVLREALGAYFEVLDRHSLADLLKQKRSLARALEVT